MIEETKEQLNKISPHYHNDQDSPRIDQRMMINADDWNWKLDATLSWNNETTDQTYYLPNLNIGRKWESIMLEVNLTSTTTAIINLTINGATSNYNFFTENAAGLTVQTSQSYFQLAQNQLSSGVALAFGTVMFNAIPMGGRVICVCSLAGNYDNNIMLKGSMSLTADVLSFALSPSDNITGTIKVYLK